MNHAFLLLLNGVRSATELTESSRLRLEKLMSIWDERSSIVCSTGFTRYKAPVIDGDGLPISESRIAARELLARGVPRSKILVEETSSDTIGNVYFAMLQFVQPLRLGEVTIVTSAFHMARVRAIAEWICAFEGWNTKPALTFETAPDPDMTAGVRRLVEEKEAAGLRNIARLRQDVRSLAAMCLWLQMEHNAYRFDARVDDLPAALRSLY